MTKRNLRYQDKKLIDKVSCLVCSITNSLEYHRVIPGDSYAPENVVILCRKHHLAVHKVISQERKLHGSNIDYQDCIDKVIEQYTGQSFSFSIGIKY